MGIDYSAVKGRGYRLEKPVELLCSQSIQEFLTGPAQRLMPALEIHDSLPSTNTYLAQLALAGAPSGTVCLAEQQSAGKGRRGRQWVSPYGHNIYLSILWRFPSGPTAISGLSLAIGVAVIRALKFCLPKEYGLKWPNDIYYQNKKLGGILIEVSGESEGPSAAIVGVGLNLYLPEIEGAAIDQEWTDLSRIDCGQSIVGRNKLAGILLNQLLLVLAEFEKSGISGFLSEWRNYDCLKNKQGSLYIGQHAYKGIIKGIDENGLLLMLNQDGNVQAFASGEVSFSKLS